MAKTDRKDRQAAILTQEPDGRLPGWPKRVLLCALAGVAFALMVAGFRAVATPGGGEIVAPKWEYLCASAQERGVSYDTLFLGSSHVYRSFVPAEFDRWSAERGAASRSFNMGIQLPHVYELQFLLRKLLERADHGYKRVFVEYLMVTPQIDPQYAYNQRHVFWHDWDQTRFSARRALELDGEVPGGLFQWHRWYEPTTEATRAARARAPGECPPTFPGQHSLFGMPERALPDAWELSGEHYKHWVLQASMAGRGKDVLAGFLGKRSGNWKDFRERGGYLSLEEEEARLLAAGRKRNDISERRAYFLANLEEYRAIVARLTSEPRYFGDLEWMNPELQQVHDLAAYRAMAQFAGERGAELVLVVMPSNTCDREVEARLQRELGCRVLFYNDPGRVPELYSEALRFDSGHHTAEGALAFTRQLARDVQDGN